MNLAELAQTTKALERRPNHSVLLYGHPKTGKTRLVGTAAKLPEIERIFWFDLENGAETLLHMGLSIEELKKITLFSIPDTHDTPRGVETVLKAFSTSARNASPVRICDAHGKVGCVICDKAGKKSSEFYLPTMTHKDLVVIDSGSQLGDSALALAMIGKPAECKPGWDEYALQGKYLSDICSVIQAAYYTNFIVATHVISIEEEMNNVKRDKYFPLIGTRSFCQKVAKYFGTVIFTEVKLGKHVAGSSSTYKNDTITGSRVNARIEADKELSMKAIFSLMTPS